MFVRGPLAVGLRCLSASRGSRHEGRAGGWGVGTPHGARFVIVPRYNLQGSGDIRYLVRAAAERGARRAWELVSAWLGLGLGLVLG